MKKIIKSLAVVLSFVMMLTIISPSNVQAAKIKLNYTKKTIYVGDTFKLKVNGVKKGIRWNSYNPNIAKVDKNGEVTGISSGKTEIHAKYKNINKKCIVTVKNLDGKDNIIYEVEKYENVCNGKACRLIFHNNNDFPVQLRFNAQFHDNNGYYLSKIIRSFKINSHSDISYPLYAYIENQGSSSKLYSQQMDITIESAIKCDYPTDVDMNISDEYIGDSDRYIIKDIAFINNSNHKTQSFDLYAMYYDSNGNVVYNEWIRTCIIVPANEKIKISDKKAATFIERNNISKREYYIIYR